MLNNPNLLKVGVDPLEDGKRVAKDYESQVLGTVDLRLLASHFSLPNPKSLATLCKQYLGIEMNKIMEIRCSDWNADSLSDEQITYASHDAYASILIYHQVKFCSSFCKSSMII